MCWLIVSRIGADRNKRAGVSETLEAAKKEFWPRKAIKVKGGSRFSCGMSRRTTSAQNIHFIFEALLAWQVQNLGYTSTREEGPGLLIGHGMFRQEFV